MSRCRRSVDHRRRLGLSTGGRAHARARSTRRLNRPSQAQVRLPMDCAIGRLRLRAEDRTSTAPCTTTGASFCARPTADENTGYMVYNSTDPMELWQWTAGAETTDRGLLQADVRGETTTDRAADHGGDPRQHREPAGRPRRHAEGPLFLTLGTSRPAARPLGCARRLAHDHGGAHILLDLHRLPGHRHHPDRSRRRDHGHGRLPTTGTTGPTSRARWTSITGRALQRPRLRWNEDMSNMCNKLWYFAGPRSRRQPILRGPALVLQRHRG